MNSFSSRAPRFAPVLKGVLARLSSALSVAAILGFVGMCLYARLNPAWADQSREARNEEQAQALLPGQRAPFISRQSTRAAQAPKAKPSPKKGKGKGKKKAAPEQIITKSPITGPVPVTAKKLDFHVLAKLIDAQVAKRMAAEGYKPSPRSDDAEFLRRLYLDLLGVVPTADKVDAFLTDKGPDKREKAIDELLANPRFGTALAEAWSNLMLPRESTNRLLNPGPLRQWLAKQFNDGVPLNKLVFDLITATGSTEENGATTYFLANASVDKITDNVTRLFLGVQLQCAQCHNHPFTDWKQTEYWGMAAFFMKTKPNVNPQMAAKKGVAPSITETAVKGGGKKKGLPDSAKIVPAKFLQGMTPRLNPSEPYRPVLARWLTSPGNPFFARAMVNRFWYQLFGRGLVQPVDDMHQENPPTHPELLAALADQFKSSGFDAKFLLRAICNSETYQRSSRSTEENKDDDKFLSHRWVRALSPPQLFDALVTVMGDTIIKKLQAKAAKAKGPMLKKGGAGPRQQFINFFRIDEGADPLEYQAGIPQALRMMNAPLFNNAVGTVSKAIQEGDNVPSQVIERLYLHALARRPSTEETERLLSYMRNSSAASPRMAYSDMLWALINSSEFAFNH